MTQRRTFKKLLGTHPRLLLRVHIACHVSGLVFGRSADYKNSEYRSFSITYVILPLDRLGGAYALRLRFNEKYPTGFIVVVG